MPLTSDTKRVSGPMPAFKPVPDDDVSVRGRSTAVKCLFSPLQNTCQDKKHIGEGQPGSFTFQKDWFSGIEDIEERHMSSTCCGCGTWTCAEHVEVTNLFSAPAGWFPPYLHVASQEGLLVKGTTCKIIMAYVENHLRLSRIAREIFKLQPREGYSTFEIQAIINACQSAQLHAYSEFVTKSWENEPIEGWWLKEEGYCENLHRVQPVNQEVCGFECDKGWWKERQTETARDWDRWGYREIGPEQWRLEQHRLYVMYGSEALRTDGGD